MRMRGVAGDEDAANLIGLGDGDTQVPETDIVEVGRERETCGFFEKRMEIVIVPRSVRRHRGMEEPAFADIDAAEELPVAVKVRIQHAIGRARWKALEFLVQFAR